MDHETFPAALMELNDAWTDDCFDLVEYEPSRSFMSRDETTEWFRAWTRNNDVTGDCWRPFGQDGSGGQAAFWLIRDSADICEQPVAFLGSEGAARVVANDLSGFLWLVAGGVGPMEATEGSENVPTPLPAVLAVAEKYSRRRTPTEVLTEAAPLNARLEAFLKSVGTEPDVRR